VQPHHCVGKERPQDQQQGREPLRLDRNVGHFHADDAEDESGEGEGRSRDQIAAAPDAVTAPGQLDLGGGERGVSGEQDLVEGAADPLPVLRVVDPDFAQLLLHQLQLALGVLAERSLHLRRPFANAGPAQLELLEEETPHCREAILLRNHAPLSSTHPGVRSV
jgi:hypothetical protein